MPITVLITASGGSAALHCLKALREQRELDLHLIAGDSSMWSVGARLADKSYVLPAFQEGYIDRVLEICQLENVQVVIPTLFDEIALFAAARERFASDNIQVAVTAGKPLHGKWQLYQFLHEQHLPAVPTYRPADNPGIYPCLLKPAAGSGSRGNIKVEDAAAYAFYSQRMKQDFVVQPYIQGREFTIDAFADQNSQIIAAVARERLRVKDGMAIAARTVDIAPVDAYLEKLVSAAQLTGVFNLQYFLTEAGDILFFDLNLRFAAGGLPLTIAAGANLPLMAVKMALGLPIIPARSYPIGLTMLRYYSEIIF